MLSRGCPKGIVFEGYHWKWRDAELVWNPFPFGIALVVGGVRLDAVRTNNWSGFSLSLSKWYLDQESLKSNEGYKSAQCVLFFIKCCDLIVRSQLYYWENNFQMLETSNTIDIYLNFLCRAGKFSLADIIERRPFRLLIQSSALSICWTLLNVVNYVTNSIWSQGLFGHAGTKASQL